MAPLTPEAAGWGMGGRGCGFSGVRNTVQEPPDLLPGAWLTLLGPGGGPCCSSCLISTKALQMRGESRHSRFTFSDPRRRRGALLAGVLLISWSQSLLTPGDGGGPGRPRGPRALCLHTAVSEAETPVSQAAAVAVEPRPRAGPATVPLGAPVTPPSSGEWAPRAAPRLPRGLSGPASPRGGWAWAGLPCGLMVRSHSLPLRGPRVRRLSL